MLPAVSPEALDKTIPPERDCCHTLVEARSRERCLLFPAHQALARADGPAVDQIDSAVTEAATFDAK